MYDYRKETDASGWAISHRTAEWCDSVRQSCRDLRDFRVYRFSALDSFTLVFRQRPCAKSSQPTVDPDWSELIASMDKMHMAMGAVKPSGNSDVDFVRLMLPHHQAAIDMAKTQLLYGKDPQMRRLAQEIITDQQSEIELMQLWLKQQHGN